MYTLIADSGADISKEFEQEHQVILVPFKITIEGETFVDDENLDLEKLRRVMQSTKNPIRTACPSPGDYLQAMEKGADSQGIFLVTITGKLSGSYNSANTAKAMFLEDHPDHKVHIFDTKSAGSGECNVLMKITELLEEGKTFEQVVEETEEYIRSLYTFFILESLDNLIKNGRMSKAKGAIAHALKVRPIMQGVDGEIELFQLHRGFKRSMNHLIDAMEKLEKDLSPRRLWICHSLGEEKAAYIVEKVKQRYPFRDIRVTPAKGLTTGYADIGGIIVTF